MAITTRRISQFEEVQDFETDDVLGLERGDPEAEEPDIEGFNAPRPKALAGTVLPDGSTPFTARQSGVAPTADAHLVTKEYEDGHLSGVEIEDDPAPATGRGLKYVAATETIVWATIPVEEE